MSKTTIAVGAMAAAATAAFAEFEKGAKIFDQKRVFEGLAANIERDAEIMIDQLKDATKGAISEIDAMATATQAMMSGMEFNQVTTALEYLQRYAKATGKSFEQLTNTIMTGMARGSVLMLDDAGIIIDQASLIADAEKKVGHALSEVEKKQALVNAAIEQMQRKLPALGGEAETVADKIQAMKTSLIDFKNGLELKTFTLGMGGLKWVSERFYDLTILMADVAIGAENMKDAFINAVGDMVIAVNQKLMDAMIGMRNALNHSLAGLWDQENPIANAAKTSLDAMVKGLDGSLNFLFDVNQTFLDAEQSHNDRLKLLYNAREELVKDQVKWSQFFTIPEGTPGGGGQFDLSGTVGDIAEKSGVNKVKDAVKELQEQINRLTFEQSIIGLDQFETALLEADFAAEQLKARYGSLIPEYEGSQVAEMVEQIRNLKIETAGIAKAFEDARTRIQTIGNVMGDTIRNFTQPLADAFLEIMQTGEMSVKGLAAALVETLEIYAAQKAAHFLMEAAYHTIMSFVDYYNSAMHSAQATAAIEGAAIMGSFVAGTALAGMAHDGITQIPDDGTWLLQKNERVVDAETNADLKEFLKSGGNNVTVEQHVTINGGDEDGVKRALPALKCNLTPVLKPFYTWFETA